MQQAADAALAQAVDAAQRTIINEFMVDWNRNGLYDHALSDLTRVVGDISIQRDAIGTLPPGTTVLEGFVGATLHTTLSGIPAGQTRPIAQLLSPLRADSPLYGQGKLGTRVRWRMGMKTLTGQSAMIDQFVGEITGFEVDSSTVTIDCIDLTNRLHESINLPLFTQTRQVAGVPTLNKYRINSQWVIDYILRRNGVYQSPPPLPTTILSITGHGSPVPEIGHQLDYFSQVGSCSEDDPIVTTGRWGVAFWGGPRSVPIYSLRADSQFRALPGTSYLFQFQADLSKAPSTPVTNQFILMSSGRGLFEGNSVNVLISAIGQISAEFYNGTTLVLTVNGPTLGTSGWTDVWVHVQFGASLSNSIVSFPTMTVNPVNLSGLSTAPAAWAYPAVSLAVALPFNALQVSDTTNTGLTTYNPSTFVSQCDLDPGLNEFASLPVRRGVDSLDLLKEVIGAEFGVAGFTEAGRFYFKNRNTVRKNNLTVEKTLNPEPSLTHLVVGERPGSVRNVITTRVQEFWRNPTEYETVWETRDPNEILAPIGISLWRVVLDAPALLRDFDNLTFVATADWDTAGGITTHRFCSVDVLTSAEINLVSVAVFADPVRLAAGVDEVTLLINNTHTSYVYFKTTDGRPALQIGGRKTQTAPERAASYSRQSSKDRYGSQVYPIDLSDWRQSLRMVQPIALGLLKDLKAPVPVLNQITAVGDPRLQLLDTADLSDSNNLGASAWVNVESINRSLSGGKLEDQMVVRLFSMPGRWILGHPTLSILGLTTIPG